MSGVYIPMDMPKNCCGCPCAHEEFDYCQADKQKHRLPYDDQLPTWCPLIPVPDHGDLIDRDAAKELMKPVDSIREREPEWTWGELHEIYCKELDRLPTIIPGDKEEEQI